MPLRLLFLSATLLTLSLPVPGWGDEALLLSGSPSPQSLRFSMTLNEKPARLELAFPSGAKRSLLIQPDKAGEVLNVRMEEWDAASKRWQRSEEATALPFWHAEEKKRFFPFLPKGEPQSWRGRPLPGVIRADEGRVNVWLADRLVFSGPLPDTQANVSFEGGTGATATFAEPEVEEARFQPGEFPLLARAPGLKPERIVRDGIPFNVWPTLPLRHAEWLEWKEDPSWYSAVYDYGPLIVGDQRMPWLQAPRMDYLAAWVLADAEADPQTVPRFTVRAGRRIGGAGRSSQVYQVDFTSPDLPRGKAMQAIRIPFDVAFAQDVEGNVLDLELTKEIRLSRRMPDPNKNQWRPLGLPSGVRVAAVTLEKSPLQMEVKPAVYGALFEAPQTPAFTVRLSNITRQPQAYRLAIVCGAFKETRSGIVPPAETGEETLTLSDLPHGQHRLEVALQDGKGEPMFTRHAPLALIPESRRAHRERSPFGIGIGEGSHFTPDNFEETAPLVRKLGFRYVNGMSMPVSIREANGLLQGYVLSARPKFGTDFVENWKERRKKHPDAIDRMMIFHENGVSGGHATRVPDLFSERPPYPLSKEEKESFEKLYAFALEAAKAMRAAFPHIKIDLGNGPVPTREIFYQAQFPEELFDSGGNENPTFNRPPETQPPDSIGNNSSLWMDRQMLDHYGYKGKPVTQAHETIYPNTNPGNLSLKTHADYLVRHYLHSAVWGMPQIRGASLNDAGDSYRYSNWGQIGLFTARPELAPKEAAVTMATLTYALDGATFREIVDTGSDSVYLPRFDRAEGGSVLPFWVVRGEREITLTLHNAPEEVLLITGEGAEKPLSVRDGRVMLTATSRPAYLRLPQGVEVESVSLGEPRHPGSGPKGKVTPLAPFASLEGWEPVKERSVILENYNPMTPRRKGDFRFESAPAAPAEAPSLKVTPQPLQTGKPTTPMVVELESKRGLRLPGKPAELGIEVHGNSSWGRIIVELEDASGQRWISIGARAKADAQWIADWLGKEAAEKYRPGEVADWNTDDQFGLSRINFDGWRYVGIPLPGQYPGEGYQWPFNAFWRSDKDGVVHYPLTLKKLVIELPENLLYLTRFAPPKNRSIHLRNLVAVERDADAPKPGAREYQDTAQIHIE